MMTAKARAGKNAESALAIILGIDWPHEACGKTAKAAYLKP
jgi:hypothetical protein